MKTLQTEVIINATPKTIWNILVDHKSYPLWNPFIKQLSGDTQVGKQLSVLIQPEGQKPMQFEPVVLVNKEEEEFRWQGKLFIKGLFDGQHYFCLEAINSEQTRFIHGEIFSGIIASLLLKMVGANTLKGFQAMNRALKERAENMTLL